MSALAPITRKGGTDNYGADGRSYTLLGPNIMRVFPVHMHSVCRKFGCLSRTHLPSFINVYETHISGLDLEPCHVRDEAGEVFRTKATGKMIVKATWKHRKLNEISDNCQGQLRIHINVRPLEACIPRDKNISATPRVPHIMNNRGDSLRNEIDVTLSVQSRALRLD